MSVSQSPSPVVPVNLARDVVALARTLVAATRTRQLYSPDHPAAAMAVDRLHAAVAALRPYPELVLGI